MRFAARATLAGVLLGLAACGESTGAEVESGGGDVPVTARALAAVAAEYAPGPSSAAAEDDAAEEFATGGVGTELNYPASGPDDGASVTLAVGTGLDPDLASCQAAGDRVDGCATVGDGTLLWEAVAPEEDPGVVYVFVPKEKGAVLMFYSGPSITQDPRELDLPISVENLFAIANDPRVDTTTSQAAVDAGEDLDFWRD